MRALDDAQAEGRVRLHQPDSAELAAWRERAAAVRSRLVREIGGEAAHIDAVIHEGLASWRVASSVRDPDPEARAP